MQFILKWEADFEVGGEKAPLTCKVRLGAAFDDQPTACLLGRGEPPIRCIESGHTDTERVGVFDRHCGKLNL